MNRDVRRRAAVAVTIAASMLLAGCASDSVPALERTATAADALPAGLVAGNGFDPETARHVASHRGVEIYLAKKLSEKFDVVCLILYQDTVPATWASSCGAGERIALTLDRANVAAEFIRHGVTSGDLRPGWTKLSDNVLVQD
ncbi:hypothetical protein [Leifsonia shinshuensis]|uniref:Lipoprotein n=1 Tax=Leifsonia shinshuensis TaxID=150026 RepID=A0A853CYE4_9MICO|nr:hypothetical protein [Leifsonia shinshuensis]NYJ24204.1 hypothetical protein [Leifsonia shinshuensis]